ncbi:hypothetical protein FJT64_012142 [Amphibalanus amphitrite]|uniref:Corticotropin-releasing factor domain-containing protein n=1 Tax=Amphibalanus amphitrite TaxID=1232801 RepID=A0A6A4V0F8_AMPAM|nr:hypothetical protein FJT64_012142 [Amphibalanus amphitrite]
MRLTRRSAGTHSQQKREASPVTGASLSINNPIRVLRNRLTLQMYRRWRNKVMENSAFLHSMGKRSTREQLERRDRGLSDNRQVSAVHCSVSDPVSAGGVRGVHAASSPHGGRQGSNGRDTDGWWLNPQTLALCLRKVHPVWQSRSYNKGTTKD